MNNWLVMQVKMLEQRKKEKALSLMTKKISNVNRAKKIFNIKNVYILQA